MLNTLAINNYRSLQDLVLPLGPLNLVTGANGSGKSSLYRALRLLAQTAQLGVIQALVQEGGLQSTFWAGPEKISRRMRLGEVPVQGAPRQETVRLRLGFSGELAGQHYGYAVALGLPTPSTSLFALDPEIKSECIWSGEFYRPAGALVVRENALVKTRQEESWSILANHLQSFDSMYSQVAGAESAPELLLFRESIRNWRFYDHFRTDALAPARQPQLATRTPVLSHDGSDLAAALQTIREIGDKAALEQLLDEAFPGAQLIIEPLDDGRFRLQLKQPGMLRPLSASELSDGTLRFLLLLAALLTPRPPALMVLNEPETSLHPELLPALARLIRHACRHSQLWVVSHASPLQQLLLEHPECQHIALEKSLGQTKIRGQGPLDAPPWYWPDK